MDIEDLEARIERNNARMHQITVASIVAVVIFVLATLAALNAEAQREHAIERARIAAGCAYDAAEPSEKYR